MKQSVFLRLLRQWLRMDVKRNLANIERCVCVYVRGWLLFLKTV